MPAILRVLHAIETLRRAPPDFTPCRLVERFSPNFDNHTDFSRRGNQTYWVCFSLGREAVYSLKPQCIAGKSWDDNEDDVVGSFACWEDVLITWAAFCFHHHDKCDRHRNICRVSGCPAHLPRPDQPPACHATVERRIKVEVKVETSPRVKLERATPKVQVRRSTSTSGSRARHSVRPASRPSPVEEDDDDDYVGGVPLYDPDTPPPQAIRSPSIEVPLYVRTPPPQPALERESQAHSQGQSGAQSPGASVTVSSASSLSASAADAPSIPAGVDKGKRRAGPLPLDVGASVSAPGPERLRRGFTAPVASSSTAVRGRGGVSTASSAAPGSFFYVSASGVVSPTREEALKNLQDGPLKVGFGWDAALDYAEKMATLAVEGAQAMEVDI
ncbi:hypothetical protein C8F04DRAFT_1264060 [Mycena alexandri]|uniref:Uncharacterized protein n=1 Tax=Mycena alexandri TaxID=1745969 RepID=A0AAD6SR33_9AGAR|nr:hypothetical protein C8F04DRAFT_1264060 [Mycena alexandri]